MLVPGFGSVFVSVSRMCRRVSRMSCARDLSWALSECKHPKFLVFWLQKMVGSGVCFVSSLGDWPGLFGFRFFVKIVQGALCLSLGFIWIRGAVWEGSLRRLVLGMDEREEKGDECQ